MAFWLALAGTLLAEAYVLRRLRFDAATVALVLSSTLLNVSYLGYTSVDDRNYDGSSHLEYIQTLANGSLPRADACGACGHPPLYYALAAAWSKLTAPWELGLQSLSLLLSFGFVVVALLILRSGGLRPWAFRFGAALIVFWPSSVIHSVRVHNDALASLSMLTAMYFTAQWDARGRAAHFWAALAACALALLTKATGYTVAVTLLLFATLPLRSSEPARRRIQPLVIAAFVLATAAALPAVLRDSRAPRTACQQVLGTACDGRYVPAAADRPRRFLYFDAVDFVRRLDTLPRDAEHDYFLNRFAKSSLFGVMPLGDELSDRRHQALGAVMSAALLAMVAFCVLSLRWLRAEQLRKYRVYLASSALMFGFLVAFRLRAPNEFHEDFRHVFPALVPFCWGYAALVQRARARWKAFHCVGVALGATMVVASVGFFLKLP